MPAPTFFNLEEAKRTRFIRRALEEFTFNNYQDASISRILKSLGVAKGSFYQYFEDKYELFIYLITFCSDLKKNYVDISRADYPSFWMYFRALYEEGLNFDRDHPLECHFLHRLQSNLNSPAVKTLFNDLMHQVVTAFRKMVDDEVAIGTFRNDVSASTMAYFLYKNSISIQENMQFTGTIDIEKSIRMGHSVYYRKRKKMMQIVDEYIFLMRPALSAD